MWFVIIEVTLLFVTFHTFMTRFATIMANDRGLISYRLSRKFKNLDPRNLIFENKMLMAYYNEVYETFL